MPIVPVHQGSMDEPRQKLGRIMHTHAKYGCLQEWWEKWLQGQDATKQITTLAILMHSTWNIICEERNWRTFEGSKRTPLQVLGLIKEEI